MKGKFPNKNRVSLILFPVFVSVSSCVADPQADSVCVDGEYLECTCTSGAPGLRYCDDGAFSLECTDCDDDYFNMKCEANAIIDGVESELNCAEGLASGFDYGNSTAPSEMLACSFLSTNNYVLRVFLPPGVTSGNIFNFDGKKDGEFDHTGGVEVNYDGIDAFEYYTGSLEVTKYEGPGGAIEGSFDLSGWIEGAKKFEIHGGEFVSFVRE